MGVWYNEIALEGTRDQPCDPIRPTVMKLGLNRRRRRGSYEIAAISVLALRVESFAHPSCKVVHETDQPTPERGLCAS